MSLLVQSTALVESELQVVKCSYFSKYIGLYNSIIIFTHTRICLLPNIEKLIHAAALRAKSLERSSDVDGALTRMAAGCINAPRFYSQTDWLIFLFQMIFRLDIYL